MVYLIAPLAIGLTFAAVVAYRERWRGLSLLSMLMAGGMCGLGALSRDPSESLELLVGSASKAVIASVCSQVSQGLTLENGVKVVSGAANFLIADGPDTENRSEPSAICSRTLNHIKRDLFISVTRTTL